MISIGLFYGSNTGQTESVAYKIQSLLQDFGYEIPVYDVEFTPLNTMLKYTHLIVGTSTWHNGGPQYSWEKQWHELCALDFTGKHVACFGLGDSENYAEWYLDYMGDIHCQITQAGGHMAGLWPTNGYYVMSEKALTPDKSHYLGLALDTINHDEFTQFRIHGWIQQIIQEWGLY